jgi:hypothetical protein
LEEKMNNSQFPVARKTGLVIQEVPDEVLVYDLEQNKAHCLNQTAALVWRSCDGKNSVSDIAGLVTREMGSAVNDDFVWLAIDQLTESGLLDNEIKPFFGQGRRDAIKKIGMASIVAVPVIASLVAPSSAMAAQSCNCTVAANCMSQTGCPRTDFCNSLGLCADDPPVPRT